MFIDRRNEKIQAMRKAYPSLGLVNSDNEHELVWEGLLLPIRSTNDLSALLDDLENDRDIEINSGESSELVHHSKCELTHSHHRLISLIKHPIREFQIRVVDFGDDRQPQAMVINSPIPPELWKHGWRDSGVCAYAPWEYPWSDEKSSIVDFVDHVLIWLFKQNVYSQTNVWLGSEISHRVDFLLRTLKPNDRCHCGADKQYKDCHRIVNGAELYGDYWIEFEKWLRVYRPKPYFETIAERRPRPTAKAKQTSA
jgi:hypothetical protein